MDTITTVRHHAGQFKSGMVAHNKGKFVTPEFTGKRFGRWVVTAFAGRVASKRKTGKISQDRVWLCRCDCGTTKDVWESGLRNGRSRSCGCLSREVASARTLPSDGAIKNKLYGDYKRQAAKRGISFILSLEGFLVLIKGNCFYCGVLPLQRNVSNYSSPDFTYNGIDRLDNSVGYVSDNVVSCCGTCNRAKDVMNFDEFLRLVNAIHSKHFTK